MIAIMEIRANLRAAKVRALPYLSERSQVCLLRAQDRTLPRLFNLDFVAPEGRAGRVAYILKALHRRGENQRCHARIAPVSPHP